MGGRYRLLEPLGTGGMGSVYLCEHVTLGRRYALKLLPAGGPLAAELVDRFRQEAQAASRIDQENVVDVLDFGEDPGGDLYYVMELLEGRTLAQLLRQEAPLSLPRALGLLEQVCRALAAAHASGVVHRDVKPDNVLVERLANGTERAKLIDFGISHVPGAGRLTRHGEIIGTPEYMAPEQASGLEVDHLTDVYAVGVLAFELLTGTLPLLGPTAIATLVAHQTLPPPAPGTRRAGLPPALDGLVLRALAKRKGERFPSMQAMAEEVARLRTGAILAMVPGRGEELSAARGWADWDAGTGRGGTISLVAPPGEAAPRPSEPAVPAAAPGPSTTRDRRLKLLAGAAIGLGLLGGAWLLMRPPAAPGGALPIARPAATPPAPAAPAPALARPAAAPAPPVEPPALTAPRRLEDDPGPPVAPASATPARPARGGAPAAGAGQPLRDPYAAPADPLKADPYR